MLISTALGIVLGMTTVVSGIIVLIERREGHHTQANRMSVFEGIVFLLMLSCFAATGMYHLNQV